MTPAMIIDDLVRRGWHVATAESLTGGLVAAELTSVPGASSAVLGGVVSYDTAVKAAVLGVDADLLRRRGAVDPEVAVQMARGVCRLLGAEVGMATTGSAGPEPAAGGSQADPVPPGTAYVAVVTPSLARVEHVSVAAQIGGAAAGDVRERIRVEVVSAALRLAADVLGAS